MELNEYDLSCQKSILLKTFSRFHLFCEEHKLRYCAGYGTVIGAVRHKGLIPWDDDIDVYMPRSDYDRFVRLNCFAKELGCEIISSQNESFYLPFAKFCDAKSTIVEYKEWPFVIGVFIDVFPLDETNESVNSSLKQEFTKNFEIYRAGNSPYEIKKMLLALKKRNFRWAAIHFRNYFFYGILGKILYGRILKKIKSITGDFYISYCGPYKNEQFPKSWFGNPILVEFEHLKMYIPQEYDLYLKNLYGDYMRLPPEEKRVSHHELYYFNFESRMTLNQVKKS